MNMNALAFAAFALLLSFSGAHAATPQPIGSALTVVNLVTAEIDRDTRTLNSGDKVHQDENIDVSADASSELKLDDETKLALGPGSRLKLDKFVYDPKKNSGSIVLNLVKGTFRFMTGVAKKPTYVIRTPAAAITVRGTIFDLYVQESGEVWGLLIEGSFQACNDRGKCRVIDEPGKLIRITGDGDVGAPVKWAGLEGKDNVPFDSAFPFIAKAPGIDPNPIFTRDIIILGNLPEKPDKPRNSDGDKPTKKSEKGKDTPKKTRTAKKDKSDDSNIVSGMDIVIGVGIGGGFGRKGGGGHNGGDGGGKMPPSRSGGGGFRPN
jgi:hypothetical protein